jgi:arginase
VEALFAAGVQVRDAGDLTEQIWAPDRQDRLAQNTAQVVASVRELADRAAELLIEDRRLLVLGGNCTIAVGMAAGLDTAGQRRWPGGRRAAAGAAGR